MGLRITGYSDDLIELDGDLDEEHSCYEDGSYVALSNGDVVYVRYSREGWLLRLKRGSGGVILMGDDDVYETNDEIEWALIGDTLVSNNP